MLEMEVIEEIYRTELKLFQVRRGLLFFKSFFFFLLKSPRFALGIQFLGL